MDIKVINTEGSEIISLPEAKKWLRIDDGITSFDELITGLISESRSYFEKRTNRSLMIHTMQRKFLENHGSIDLFYEASEITKLEKSVKGKLEIIEESNYYFDEFNSTLEIDGILEPGDFYIVEFKTKQLKDDVVKQALKRIIKDAFDQSGDPAKKVKSAVDRVIHLYKRWRFK